MLPEHINTNFILSEWNLTLFPDIFHFYFIFKPFIMSPVYHTTYTPLVSLPVCSSCSFLLMLITEPSIFSYPLWLYYEVPHMFLSGLSPEHWQPFNSNISHPTCIDSICSKKRLHAQHLHISYSDMHFCA